MVIRTASVFDYGKKLGVVVTTPDGTLTAYRVPVAALVAFLEASATIAMTTNVRAEAA